MSELLKIPSGTYPHKGCTTVIDTINLYEGYFANYLPGVPPYGFIPQPGWKVTYAKYAGGGTFGCKQGHVVVHIIVERIIPISDTKEYPTIILIGVVVLLAYLLLYN